MKKLFVFMILIFLAANANSEVINLICVGTNPDGKTETLKFDFSPDEGWIDYGIRITHAVTATHISGILFGVNRQTGEFWMRDKENTPNYTGICKKNETKF